MSVDNLSISFASSMGIDNIKDEFLKEDVNLYTDLDDLEKSVEAEFEQYMNQARTFPFHNQSRDHPDLKDASVHSDYDILGAELIEQVNNESAKDDSWRFRLDSSEVDDNYNVKPLRNINGTLNLTNSDRDNQRTDSPGAYFGARSLPLNTMDDLWQQTQRSKSFLDIDEQEHEELLQIKQPLSFVSMTTNSKYNSNTREMLEARFKSLPDNIRLFPKYELPDIKLHHPYTQKNSPSSSSSISSTHQQYSYKDKRHSSSTRNVKSLDSFLSNVITKEPPCIIEPSSPLYFLCEIGDKTIHAKVIHLKITNSSPNIVRSFSLFSQCNLLEFELSEGVLLEHEVVDIKIKIRSSALSSYRRRTQDEYQSLQDKILVLIDKQYVNELEVQIDFISLVDEEEQEEEQNVSRRPKCKYCALEKGYALHCCT